MKSRVPLVKRFAGLNWAACFDVLRISTLPLLVAAAEHRSPELLRFTCSPEQSLHADELNTYFNEALRTISECIKPTLVNFLPLLAASSLLKIVATTRLRNYFVELIMRIILSSDDVLFS